MKWTWCGSRNVIWARLRLLFLFRWHLLRSLVCAFLCVTFSHSFASCLSVCLSSSNRPIIINNNQKKKVELYDYWRFNHFFATFTTTLVALTTTKNNTNKKLVIKSIRKQSEKQKQQQLQQRQPRSCVVQFIYSLKIEILFIFHFV